MVYYTTPNSWTQYITLPQWVSLETSSITLALIHGQNTLHSHNGFLSKHVV